MLYLSTKRIQRMSVKSLALGNRNGIDNMFMDMFKEFPSIHNWPLS